MVEPDLRIRTGLAHQRLEALQLLRALEGPQGQEGIVPRPVEEEVQASPPPELLHIPLQDGGGPAVLPGHILPGEEEGHRLPEGRIPVEEAARFPEVQIPHI